MKIAVYAIALNEAKHVERWLRSSDKADCRVFCDTGSTDGGDMTAYKWEPHVITSDISIRPWRFDDARNAALALVPADVDVCIALDLDEVLLPGWREAVEQSWTPDTTRLFYPFDLGDGAMTGHRIHARHSYRWAFPIHEALVPKHGVTENIQTCDQILIAHKPSPATHRAYYLAMLASAVKEYPNSSRMAFYYGRELLEHRRFREALEQFNRYFEIDEPRPPSQHFEAMDLVRQCLSESYA
jgi:hypothetical protein